jgi:hypothetical protein
MRISLPLLTLFCLVLCAPVALAARLEIPLRVPFESIRQALSAQLVYREGPCRYLKLETPHLDGRDGQLRLVGPGSAALGVELLGNCQNAAAWQGSMQFTSRRTWTMPDVCAAHHRFHLTDTGGNAPALVHLGAGAAASRLEHQL